MLVNKVICLDYVVLTHLLYTIICLDYLILTHIYKKTHLQLFGKTWQEAPLLLHWPILLYFGRDDRMHLFCTMHQQLVILIYPKILVILITSDFNPGFQFTSNFSNFNSQVILAILITSDFNPGFQFTCNFSNSNY